MRECCDEFALSLVGGNLSRGDEVSIVVTVTGEVVPGRAVRRDGARPGDRVVVTGSLGGSAGGLRVASQRSWSDDERDALRRYMRPTPRVGEAGVLAGHGVTSMMDVSDGLALDLSTALSGEPESARASSSRGSRRTRRHARRGARRRRGLRAARDPPGPRGGRRRAVGAPPGVRGVAQRHRRHHRSRTGQGARRRRRRRDGEPFDDRRGGRRLGSLPVAGDRREHARRPTAAGAHDRRFRLRGRRRASRRTSRRSARWASSA